MKNSLKNLEKSLFSNSKSNFNLPTYSALEEIFNSSTHAMGIIFSIVVFIFLILKYKANNLNLFSLLVYCFSLFTLYVGSTFYHFVKKTKIKNYFRKFDHCSIFLLISGTYTPICINFINCIEAKIVLAVVWILAIVGIILNMIDVNKFSKISLICYILMGWSIVFITKSAIKYLSNIQLIWLLMGGIFYTIGAVIYVIGKKVKYMHSIWHLFVLAGSIFHFMIFI